MNAKQQKLLSRLSSPFLFRWFTRKMVPAANHAGVKLIAVDENTCQILVPNKPRNKNPFRSMYFAVQSMGAEMSTALLGMLHMEGFDESIAWIVIDFEADFPAKATADVTFTCSQGQEVKRVIQECISSGEAQTIKLKTVGKMPDGKVVSEFTFHWSFKKRS